MKFCVVIPAKLVLDLIGEQESSVCSLTSPGQAWIPVLARLRAEALRRASTGMTGLGSKEFRLLTN